MLTQEQIKEFIRNYKEVVLETPYGEVHICGDKSLYEERLKAGKPAFSPSEVTLLHKLPKNASLETLIKIKLAIPGAKLKDVIPANNESEKQP